MGRDSEGGDRAGEGGLALAVFFCSLQMMWFTQGYAGAVQSWRSLSVMNLSQKSEVRENRAALELSFLEGLDL